MYELFSLGNLMDSNKYFASAELALLCHDLCNPFPVNVPQADIK